MSYMSLDRRVDVL